MKLNISFAKNAILDKGGVNHIKMDIIPPQKEKEKTNKPSLIILVLDKSGSMNAPVFQTNISSISQTETVRTKIKHAINSTIKFINLLTSEDLFGVVSFNDYADISQPLYHITPENREIIESNIKSIKANNFTNISNAMKKARKMITKKHIKDYNCKIIVLSDGRANIGLQKADEFSELALSYLKEGISVSALGIGYDYDSEIMNAIATGGGGIFYHVEDIEMLIDIFKEELNYTTEITAKNVRLLMDIPELVEVLPNLNDFKQEIKDGRIEVYIGDMYTQRSVYFEIRNNFAEEDFFIDAEVEYLNMNGEDEAVSASELMKVVKTQEELDKEGKNQEIIDAVIKILKNKTIRETSYYADTGNIEKMEAYFNSSMHEIKNLTTLYSVSDAPNTLSAVNELTDLQKTYTSGNVSKKILKARYANSNRILREQK